MRYAVLLFLAAPVLAAQLLTISPPVITQCTFGLGRATLTWNAPAGARVQIRIGDRNGPPMTAITDATGSAETGTWVSDGLVFVLVNDAGYQYDQVTAHLNCGGTVDTTASALTASTSYFPLATGNQWIYRTNSRIVTSAYNTMTLTDSVEAGGKTYFVLETRAGENGTATVTLVRSDDQGRIYFVSDYPNNTSETVWLDPTGGPATLQVQGKDTLVNTPAGLLPIGLQYEVFGGLTNENGAFGRGLGLLNSTTNMLTGSSGGFLSSLALVESRIGAGLYFRTPATSVELAAESPSFNVTGKQVTNCAVPCYFVACGLAPGSDPPGTYKPCFQARVRVGQSQCATPAPVVATLDLLNTANQSVYSATFGMTVPVVRCETAAYHQVPLYSTPNSPLPSGAYRLNVRVTAGSDEVGSASVPLRVE